MSRYSDDDSSGTKSESDTSSVGLEDDAPNEGSYRYTKVQNKIERSFAIRLLEQADAQGWDMEDIGRIMGIIAIELRITGGRKLLDILDRLSCGGDPDFLSKLSDADIELSNIDILSLLYSNATKTAGNDDDSYSHTDDDNNNRSVLHRVITLVARGCDVGLFDLNLDSTIYDLKNMFRDEMNSSVMKRYCLMLCEQCNTKKQAGRILNVFCEDMMQDEACKFIHEIVTRTSFRDLEGKMKKFWSQFVDGLGDSARLYLEKHEKVSRHGELQDEDEDDHGNLKGFIDSSSEDFGSNSDKGASSGSDDEDGEDLEDTWHRDERLGKNMLKHIKKNQRVIDLVANDSADEEEEEEEDSELNDEVSADGEVNEENSVSADTDSTDDEMQQVSGSSARASASRKRKIVEDTDSD